MKENKEMYFRVTSASRESGQKKVFYRIKASEIVWDAMLIRIE